MIPLKKALMMKGLIMKNFFAPTNCILRIRKRWEYIESLMEFLIMTKTINKLNIAKRQEKLLEFEEAAETYKELGMDNEVIRIRKLKAEQGAVKVSQKVVHGDEVTKTEIKDSVLNRSNVGSGGDDKLTKIKELKELHDAGAIDDDEFKQMKKEILGK